MEAVEELFVKGKELSPEYVVKSFFAGYHVLRVLRRDG